MKIHEVASLFPVLQAKEMRELREDIQENGIKVPILVNKKKDTILDGRNRYMIANELKLGDGKVPMEVFKGEDGDIPGEIISRNILRRHLTDDQRVTLLAKIRGPQLEKGAAERKKGGQFGAVPLKSAAPGDAAAILSKEAQVGRDKGRAALDVAKHAKDIVDDVISGKVPLRKAAKIAKARKPKRAAKPKKVKTLKERVIAKYLGFMDAFPITEHREVKRILHEQTAP